VAIEKHYAALFVRDQHYKEELEQIANLEASKVAQNRQLENLQREIANLEQELSEAVKGAEQINKLLAAYFGSDDLRVEASVDNQFKILRGGVVARNLSEGEKTAIAFAYFITRVQDGRHPLADTRVVIDDPISSLDANHLFNTYALIKTQLAECRQLFVATHSFEFFNLLREWAAGDEKSLKKPPAQWQRWGIFLVKRLGTGTAVLEDIPMELLRFKSEYHYLFSLLYQFSDAKSGDFGSLLTLPNVARRFMEAFGGIMIPSSNGLEKKMDRLFPDAVARERVWKFVNSYSHNRTSVGSLLVPDISECVSVVDACLAAVKRWNATYFDELVSEIS
jgi:wobble nucleotide-excising tRNase